MIQYQQTTLLITSAFYGQKNTAITEQFVSVVCALLYCTHRVTTAAHGTV